MLRVLTKDRALEMFRSGLGQDHNEVVPAVIKRQTIGESRTSHTVQSFRASTQDLFAAIAQKEKDPLRAA